MARLNLQPNPTFQAKVSIPVPGAEPVEVTFTFKHRSRSELDAYQDVLKDLKGLEGDVQLIMDLAMGWELEDEFNAANVSLLADNYYSSAMSIWGAYLKELNKAKEKN